MEEFSVFAEVSRSFVRDEMSISYTNHRNTKPFKLTDKCFLTCKFIPFCFLDCAFSIMKTKINQQNAQINSGLIYY